MPEMLVAQDLQKIQDNDSNTVSWRISRISALKTHEFRHLYAISIENEEIWRGLLESSIDLTQHTAELYAKQRQVLRARRTLCF